jgi:hypothetical protein
MFQSLASTKHLNHAVHNWHDIELHAAGWKMLSTVAGNHGSSSVHLEQMLCNTAAFQESHTGASISIPQVGKETGIQQPQEHSQPPPPTTLIFIILTIIPKPLLQLPTQPPVTPQALNPPTPDLPLLPAEIKPDHTLALLIAKSLEIAIPISPASTAAIRDLSGRPREACQEI